MSLELKIKSKHLGLEAKVIKHEEKKLKNQIRWQCDRGTADCNLVSKYQSIHNHRVWDVRNENRATFLARAFIAGKPYNSVEHKVKDVCVRSRYILPRVVEMVYKYRFQRGKDLNAVREEIRTWFGERPYVTVTEPKMPSVKKIIQAVFR